ncbi:TRAP transporter small permease subunit [Sulfitobacter sp. M57]|uniref:TRAP transporter small permease n=1 Tax=unclassified Sulfitobacter TaxID=196795 RepID=UPI0023E13B57|nr:MULTISPECIES: TRAP transporter small permease subunit [unclassified Sulfitobacter]MDF3416531.1 TRAP transporter small permease subunit [Sulfitobacter sp. KE5]MDF3424029.1 TRAP transporter small permease subunit [Sulfitobacter sp. KE43]MDF3435015.1 TRAP transporter small permease subunit [Sulfitobacter sp. KE42]MDF3460666.1 TRAP transporter small permease subunit [Sulfitobacter sp. S74]MDF3464620.1 TRAP transporter small permease subunit [Sulfitobacter sp. Ks18]
MLYRLSAAWARIELWMAALLAVGVTLLVLLNVVTRTAGNALFWVDELAIYAMAWMTFLGASAALHHRSSVAVTLLPEAVSPNARYVLLKCVDVVVFAFSLLMLWFCWRWFLPLDLMRAGFDTVAFQGQTFNFVYAEPTSTLGVPKYLFWSVIWLFSIGATLHSAMHLFGKDRPS